MLVGVEKIFDEHIRFRFLSKPDVAQYLINHERKPLVLNNLCEQVKLAENSNIGVRFNGPQFKQIVKAGADLFAKAALDYLEENLITQAEKARRISEASELDDIADCLAEGDEIVNELD